MILLAGALISASPATAQTPAQLPERSIGNAPKPTICPMTSCFEIPVTDLVCAIRSGGCSLYAKKDIGANGWVAEFEDSEGNRIAISQSR